MRKPQKLQSGDHQAAASGVSSAMNSRLLGIQGVKLYILKRLYDTLSKSDRVLEVDNDDHNVEENIAGDSTCIDESEVSGCNSAISTDIEGI